MASKTSHMFAAILLLFVMMLPHTIQSKPSGNPFGFIKKLEGCHKGQTVHGLHDLKKYLEKFGYLNYDHHRSDNGTNHANDNEFDDLLESAIKTYQHNYHLQATGSLDNKTVNQMMKPRCGVPDIVINGTNHYHHHHHHKSMLHSVAHYRFFPGPRRWPTGKTHLRYRFQSSVQVPRTYNVRSVCARAFQRWEQVTHFTFEEVGPNSAFDIEIGFHRLSHGDGNPFDGRGGTLAHALAPTGGRFHYDSDENWSTNPSSDSEVDLESVAVHEIGHLIGLHHSEDPNAIMYAYFGYGRIKRDLQRDDIQGIQALYGLQ